MTPLTTRENQKLALFGLGGSGMVTAQALLAGSADLVAFDDNPERVDEAKSNGITTADLRSVDFASCTELVLAPGVPLTHPKPHWSVELATQAGIAIVGDVGLFADQRRAIAPDSPFIAITGTNGKSTTTALISHILGNAGKDVQMGGNIGRAVLSLDPPSGDKIHVVECSSYQIDLAPQLDPQIGILLNLVPDHLDRHGTMQNYASIKARLVAGSQHPVIGVDDSFCAGIADDLENEGKKVTRISVRDQLANGIFCKGETIIRARNGKAEEVASLENIASLKGVHNRQNACAAWAACELSGLSAGQIQDGFSSFPGLAHRMEVMGKIDNVSFVNDSKATNSDAAAMALSSFEQIYWIAGGLAKEGGIEGLRHLFANVEKAYLIGEAAPEFAATLGNEVPFEISQTIELAVKRAAEDAASEGNANPVVLLSPACASFDQFANFELRGEAFRQVVNDLGELISYGSAQ